MDLTAAPRAFHFLRPAWLVALPALWGLALWLARRRDREGDWAGVIDPELLPGLRLAGAGAGGRSPWPWLALAWTLAALALAGPTWERDVTPGYRGAAAWVLVLDLSPSMTATDLSPDRATRARYAVDDLLSAARDARVGLVVFSDEPYAVTPLTDDVATVRSLLPPLSPDIMPSPGDDLAPALGEAGSLLKQGGAKAGRVIVLTDGFADPAAALDAARRLRSGGATVDVVGIGTRAGAPLAGAGGDFVPDAQGRPRMARLDEGLLRRLAESGGGRYVDLARLPALIADLQSLPDRTGGASRAAGVEVSHWRDAGVWLLPALLLLAAALARRGWL
jgi:Ca-activated chloride channel homolog